MATEKRLIPLQKRIVYAGDVFNSLMAEKGWSATEASDFMKVFRMVDAVEVVHGRWEDYSDDRHHWKRMDLRCSICHKRASSFVGGSEDWWDSYKPNYCPNCGAKMDGGKDNG
jgi:hypothetical protein